MQSLLQSPKIILRLTNIWKTYSMHDRLKWLLQRIVQLQSNSNFPAPDTFVAEPLHFKVPSRLVNTIPLHLPVIQVTKAAVSKMLSPVFFANSQRFHFELSGFVCVQTR